MSCKIGKTIIRDKRAGTRGNSVMYPGTNGPFPIRQSFKLENNFGTVGGKSFLNLVKL